MRVSLLAVLAVSVASEGGVGGERSRKLFEWGRMFGGLAPSENVKYECKYNGQPICCGLAAEPVLTPEVVKIDATLTKNKCQISRVYVASPYENLHFEMAANLSLVKDVNERKEKLVQYIRNDIDASNAWLARVHDHMASENDPTIIDTDYAYLSRYQVTKSCAGAGGVAAKTSWVEWIEPLTIHARHPFALRACTSVYTEDDLKRQKYRVEKQSKDHVLVQSGMSIHEATALSHHDHDRFEAHRNHHAVNRGTHIQTHNYFFDAGTSTFDSSLKWFLCAYLQRKILFDQDYGFEYTLLEPQAFWKGVPPLIRPLYHFFNAPVSAGSEDTDLSPLKMMKLIAVPEDFVSFKLDIDTPTVEIPMAMELLQTPELLSLIDEFFFELHFRCEILMYCGWGDKMPQEYNGLQLDRESAMKFFRKFREAGVRSHFWP